MFTDLLDELQRIFDNRPSKATVRKKFVKRDDHGAKTNPFASIISTKLRWRITIDQEKLVDFIIDRIPYIRLRDQAITQRLQQPEYLLDSHKYFVCRATLKR
jgi:hypothetical protein